MLLYVHLPFVPFSLHLIDQTIMSFPISTTLFLRRFYNYADTGVKNYSPTHIIFLLLTLLHFIPIPTAISLSNKSLQGGSRSLSVQGNN